MKIYVLNQPNQTKFEEEKNLLGELFTQMYLNIEPDY